MGQGQAGGHFQSWPEPDPGGTAEPQGLTPPYDRDDSPENQAAAADGVGKAFRAEEYGGEPGPTPPVSQEEREGVPPTDRPVVSTGAGARCRVHLGVLRPVGV
jgi:hypothetical protein